MRTVITDAKMATLRFCVPAWLLILNNQTFY